MKKKTRNYDYFMHEKWMIEVKIDYILCHKMMACKSKNEERKKKTAAVIKNE